MTGDNYLLGRQAQTGDWKGSDLNSSESGKLHEKLLSDFLWKPAKALDRDKLPGAPEQPEPVSDKPAPPSAPSQTELPLRLELKSSGAPGSAKSGSELAAAFEQTARNGLLAAHKDLTVMDDCRSPRKLAYLEHYQTTGDATVLALAQKRLGDGASAEQLNKYATEIMKLNGLKGEADKLSVKASTQMKLPGQTSDGGIVLRGYGKTTTVYLDGSSLEVSDRGGGTARYKNTAGFDVAVQWNPAAASANLEMRVRGDEKEVHLGQGKTYYFKKAGDKWQQERIVYKGEHNATITEHFKPGEPGTHLITVSDRHHNHLELTPGEDRHFHGVKKDSHGRILDAHVGMDIYGDIFSDSQQKDGTTRRKWEDGTIQKLNARGHRLEESGKDSYGRSYLSTFKPGESEPEKYALTLKAGEKAIEFKRSADGRYVADYMSADGKEKLGTIEKGSGGLIVYENTRDKSARAERPDGAVIERTQLAGGGYRVSTVKGKESVTTTFEAIMGRSSPYLSFQKCQEDYKLSDGRQVAKFLEAGSTVRYSIKESDGSLTELTRNHASERFEGQRKDRDGNVVEKAVFKGQMMVYTDVASGALRAEALTEAAKGSIVPMRFAQGKYDPNGGTFTLVEDGQTKVISFAPGRIDTVNGTTVEGVGSDGQKTCVKSSGQTTITYVDGEGARLNCTGKPERWTIDRFGASDDEKAIQEPLTKGELACLTAHKDIDRRDLLEIHRRLQGNEKIIDTFYDSLARIDSAKSLNNAEKSSLRRNIMHHVGFPREIYQGSAPTCNAGVLQRDMVLNSPDKYADFIFNAVAKGEQMSKDGTLVKFDVSNLKMLDSSGRDLATRIFHTAALQTAFYPKREFRNSDDGLGRVHNHPFNTSEKPAVFDGLNMAQIADARYKLTGEEKAVVMIGSSEDLVTAFELNGGGPMIIAVDGGKAPLGYEKQLFDPSQGNHVVTITAIEKSPLGATVYLQNQWGLDSDHSTESTAVDAVELVANMQFRGIRNGRVLRRGEALCAADSRKKVYRIDKGALVVDATETKAAERELNDLPEESKHAK